MANDSLLDAVLLAPNGGNQSFLEGIFHPGVQYDELTNGVLGYLSNDNTNALRRTNSAMNNYLMALKDDGTLRHRQVEKCDVIGLNVDNPVLPPEGAELSPCPNGFKSSARIKRCSRRENESGYRQGKELCHRRINNFLVCDTCGLNLRNHPMVRREKQNALRTTRWAVCAVCTGAQERQHPYGAQLCMCFTEIERRRLCVRCILAKFEFLVNEAHYYYIYSRWKIGRDDDGQVKFDRPNDFGEYKFADERKRPRCLGCGIQSFDFDLAVTGRAKICFMCRNYDVVPSQLPQTPRGAPMGHRSPTGLRRTARLNPTLFSIAHVQLSPRGTALRPITEPQDFHGVSSATPTPSRKRKAPP